jgi:hypothetical protein
MRGGVWRGLGGFCKQEGTKTFIMGRFECLILAGSGRSALESQPTTTGLRSTVGIRLPRRLHDKGRYHA